MSDRSITLTPREADILMMAMCEATVIVERLNKCQWPVEEHEFRSIADKARTIVWQNIQEQQALSEII